MFFAAHIQEKKVLTTHFPNQGQTGTRGGLLCESTNNNNKEGQIYYNTKYIISHSRISLLQVGHCKEGGEGQC